jgi:hypothetical protein
MSVNGLTSPAPYHLHLVPDANTEELLRWTNPSPSLSPSSIQHGCGWRARASLTFLPQRACGYRKWRWRRPWLDHKPSRASPLLEHGRRRTQLHVHHVYHFLCCYRRAVVTSISPLKSSIIQVEKVSLFVLLLCLFISLSVWSRSEFFFWYTFLSFWNW